VLKPLPRVTLDGYNELLEFEDVEEKPIPPEEEASGVLTKRGNVATVALALAAPLPADAGPATLTLHIALPPQPGGSAWKPFTVLIHW